ncbi:glycosyltransferase family 4 protein [Leptospira santarosai]|uniref:glycosyltransferase family 4 protein n=1 Tax=Leptospira santarosai TaxID=28183 RepID=UPI0002BA9793|nr:glycosyltransferase family 1 protein [Leptospira santarosai]EMF92445.1 glycosyltransferase, group 1 family protein [Leptospira santarosai str. ST188]EMO20844.1 glycosyltransferase, group 1 family protein [Leptospira santarosai str. HAI134]EMO31286.1 glycosyltransferase, group 1 family protein [Leptospira santarosai str. HAI821]EMO72649.1 glycosyltransferase, group 1 family protein [Leptospira santarosai str. 200403458]EMP00252.1 glycosyltransferase, group 1 family protein [Leptospira santar
MPIRTNELKYKPRVGVDVRPLAYGITGNSRYLAEVLRRLITSESPLEYYLYSNKPIHTVFYDILSNVNSRFFVTDKLPGFLWLNWTIPKRIKKDRLDLFWGTLQLLPFSCGNVLTAVNYHDLNFRSAPQTMTTSNFWQHRILSPKTLNRADLVFCLSENTRQDILKFKTDLSPKLKVIYPGVESFPSVREPLRELSGNFLFTIGTLEPRKNLRILIDAYRKLKKQNSSYPFSLVIAGRLGWKSEGLTQLLKEGSLESEGILFVENPADEVLAWLYRRCSAFLFPSIHEGFGLPLLEALREGKICVASDIPVFHEILEREVDLFAEPLDVDSWVSSLSELQHKKLRRPSVWDASQWTWDLTAKKIEEGLIDLWKHRKELYH